MAAATGAVAALALPPFDLWPLAFPAFAIIVALVATAPDARSAAWRGWSAGAGWFALSMHWIVQPFFVEAAVTGWMAPFALVLMAGGLALFWALAAWVSAWFAPHGPGRALAFAGALTLAEALRGRAFTGLPWAEPGHGVIATEALALSALAGPAGLTLVLLAVAACSAVVYLVRGPMPAAVPLALGLALGLIPWAAPAPPPTENAPVLRIVQINAPQALKWQPDMIPVFFDRALGLTAAPPGPHGAPDIVIWPETSLPVLVRASDDARARIAEAAGSAQVIVGGQRYAGIEPRNVLLSLTPDGGISQIYDKHHLVPFGEYLPLRGLADRLGVSAVAQQLAGGYRPGAGPGLVDMGDLGRAFPMICYEAIFPHYIRTVDRPDWMVQITNDAWFGSFAMPYQHLALARLRAAEQGLPLIRAANTGISAVIDARGTVVEALPMDTQGALDLPMPVALPPTLYSRTGDLPALLLALMATIVGVLLGRRHTAH